MYDVLEEGTDEVVLARPKRVKAIAAARIKTDKIDANILAHLARADLLPPAYAPPVEIRELRDLVRHRSKLVRERTRHKNRIHTILSKYNLHSPCTDLFGKKGRAFLDKVQKQLSANHQLMLGNYLCLIDALNEHIKSVNQVIRTWAKDDSRIKLLTSMPGVGIYSTAVIIAEIGEISRFVGPKQLCSYAAWYHPHAAVILMPGMAGSPKRDHPGCDGSLSVLRNVHLVPVHGSLTSTNGL
jgi:transposase